MKGTLIEWVCFLDCLFVSLFVSMFEYMCILTKSLRNNNNWKEKQKSLKYINKINK